MRIAIAADIVRAGVAFASLEPWDWPLIRRGCIIPANLHSLPKRPYVKAVDPCFQERWRFAHCRR